MVRPVEDPWQPGIIAAVDLLVRVCHAEVPQDIRPFWVSGTNDRASMNDTSGLIKVNRVLDVGGND